MSPRPLLLPQPKKGEKHYFVLSYYFCHPVFYSYDSMFGNKPNGANKVFKLLILSLRRLGVPSHPTPLPAEKKWKTLFHTFLLPCHSVLYFIENKLIFQYLHWGWCVDETYVTLKSFNAKLNPKKISIVLKPNILHIIRLETFLFRIDFMISRNFV